MKEGYDTDMKNELKQSLLEILGSEEFDITIRNAGKFRFPTNYMFGVHNHREFEVNYINSGSCVMEIGGVLTSLKHGDCVIISPEISHYFMVGMHKGCSIVQLEYTLTLPPGIADPLQIGKREYIQISDCVSVGTIMEGICRYFREEIPDMYKKPQLEFGFAQLYMALAYILDEDAKKEGNRPVNRQSQLLRYINQYYDSKLNIEELADSFGISSRSVRKFFEDTLGMNCTEYITMLRMEKAKGMLWNTQKSITDIAVTVGYSSSQYFSNVFRQYTGMTPGKFRSSWRGVIAEERLYE